MHPSEQLEIQMSLQSRARLGGSCCSGRPPASSSLAAARAPASAYAASACALGFQRVCFGQRLPAAHAVLRAGTQGCGRVAHQGDSYESYPGCIARKAPQQPSPVQDNTVTGKRNCALWLAVTGRPRSRQRAKRPLELWPGAGRTAPLACVPLRAAPTPLWGGCALSLASAEAPRRSRRGQPRVPHGPLRPLPPALAPEPRGPFRLLIR
jgi:hypothetical protein